GNHQQQQGIRNDSRSQQAASYLTLRQTFGNGTARGIPDEPFGVIHFLHDLVTRIDTGTTAYAHVLETIADIDAGRAYLNTQGAIDAVAHPCFFVIDTPGTPATRLTALVVVRDDKCVVVDHHALKACVRTAVLASCRWDAACVAPGCKGRGTRRGPLRGLLTPAEQSGT